MKCFLAAIICAIGVTSCQSTSTADGGPVPNAIKTPIQSFQEASVKELSTWGFNINATDLGEDQYGLYIHITQPASEAINKKKLEINFSLWSEDNQFVFAMPKIDFNHGPFLLIDGYTLRIVVNTTEETLGLLPGVGYTIDIDPADHID